MMQKHGDDRHAAQEIDPRAAGGRKARARTLLR
jgi:hypothetical protein